MAHVIRAELGQPPERAFFEFSPEPVAAASIGQVHRARLFDGTPVAVKVQYPGVDVAIRADLDNAFLLYSAARAIAPGIDPEPVVSELRERMGEELDYRIEAANQEEFRAAYEGHPWVRIPAVHREIVDRAGAGQRVGVGPVVLRPARRAPGRAGPGGGAAVPLLGGLDQHDAAVQRRPPSGQLLLRGGRLGIWFLDFGLVKRFEAEEIEQLRERVAALRSGDDDAVIDVIKRHGWLRPGTKIDQKRMVELARLSVLPLVDHRPFTYTREYIGRDASTPCSTSRAPTAT